MIIVKPVEQQQRRTMQLCENEKCLSPVPVSKNVGRPRKFCSIRCRNATHARRYYARESGSDANGELREVNGEPCVFRMKAPNLAAAKSRFMKHLLDCANNEGGKCPARFDVYDDKKACLIHAVLREDYDEIRRREGHLPFERLKTTETGFWAF